MPVPAQSGLAGRSFRHRYPPYAVSFGPDALEQLGRALAQAGQTSCLLTTGASLGADAEAIETIRRALAPARVVHFAGTRRHCPLETVSEAVALLRAEELEAVVAVGGGSTSDHAKAVAMLAVNELEIELEIAAGRHFVRLPSLGAPRPGLYCAPTTYSGAEATYGGALTVGEPPVKFIFTCDELFPDLLALDPRLFLRTPRRVLVATGMNALNHAVSRFVSELAQPLVESQFLYAFQALYGSLPAVWTASGPEWEDAASLCMLAAHLSQSTNVLGGVAHACCHVLGARLNAPHGVLNGIVLPHVVEQFEGRPAERARELADAAGVEGPLADALSRLLGELELPIRLREVGLARADIPAIAEEILADFSFAQAAGMDWSARVAVVLENAW